MISSLRLCKGHVPVPPVEVQVWCTPLEHSSGQVSSLNFHLFPCVPHRGVGYSLWITSKALLGVKLEKLSIASFCYTIPMYFSVLRNTFRFLPHKPAFTVFFCAHVFVAAILQQTLLIKSPSCLASFLLTAAACQAPMSDVQKAQLILKVTH